jgi:amino acid transporter
MASSTPAAPNETRRSPLRQVGFLPLLALFYAYTAGGPFGYESIFRSAGPGMAILFLVVVPFFWSIPISFAAAELNGILPVEGGFYRWVRAAFGDFWGFQCGWWNWTGTFLLNTVYGVMLMDYIANYIPMNRVETWAGASLVLALFAWLNVRGIRVAGWVGTGLQLLILGPVVWLCVSGFLHWHFNPMVPFVPPGKPLVAVFGTGLGLAMWNYAGYEQLSTVTEEIEDQQRNFLRVLFLNTPLNIVTYVLPAMLAIAVLGNWQDWHTGYIVTASRLVGGPALGAAMLVASILGVASLSNSTILYTTRIPAAMAEDGYLPRWLGGIHERYGTPARAIVVSAVIYCILAGWPVVNLVNVYIWTRIATSLLTVLAAWRLRRKWPHVKRRFRIPWGGVGLAYVVLPVAALCAVKMAGSEPYVFRWAPVLLAGGPVAYAIFRWGFHLKPEKPILPPTDAPGVPQ